MLIILRKVRYCSVLSQALQFIKLIFLRLTLDSGSTLTLKDFSRIYSNLCRDFMRIVCKIYVYLC